MPKVAAEIPKNLRPYQAHGVILAENGANAKGDCPFCGREGKFSVRIDTGVAKCWVCEVNPEAPKGGVNPRSFIQRLWEIAVETTTDKDLSALLAARPGIRSIETLRAWGCAKGNQGDWVVPGWDAAGRLCQLYRWGHDKILRATPKADGILSAGLFIDAGAWDEKKLELWVAEGPWDGMAWQEALGTTRKDEEGYRVASDPALSLLAWGNVVALPGVGAVGEPLRALLPVFEGKRVKLMFDSDHPRRNNGTTTMAGRDAARRAAELLSPVAASVSWLRWGKDGYDPTRPSGYDLRDRLKEAV